MSLNRTYQEILQNEIRPIEITINDSTGAPFTPSAAFATVYDSDGDVVISEQGAMVSSNRVYSVIGTAVTANVGTYMIKWRIVYGNYTYYHATDLEVLEL